MRSTPSACSVSSVAPASSASRRRAAGRPGRSTPASPTRDARRGREGRQQRAQGGDERAKRAQRCWRAAAALQGSTATARSWKTRVEVERRADAPPAQRRVGLRCWSSSKSARRSHGRGWRAAGAPPARARARAGRVAARASRSPPAAKSGSSDERVASCAASRDLRARRVDVAAPRACGARRRRSASARWRLPRRPTRPTQRDGATAAARSRRARGSRSGRRAARRARGDRARRQRPAAGDPAGAQQRDDGVAGHEPRPVDERVHAEDDARPPAASAARCARACTARPRSRRRSPVVRAARRQPGGEQRERDAPARRARGRRASARRSRGRGARRASSLR